MTLDLSLSARDILTLDPARPTASAVGVFGGRIVGFDDDVVDLPRAKISSRASTTRPACSRGF